MKIKSLLNIPSIAEYLSRIGAEPRSLRTAVVKQQSGNYWKDIAYIRFNPSTSEVDAPAEYAPTENELALIKSEMPKYAWPMAKLLGKTFALPAELQGVPPDSIFEFRDKQGNLIMLQHRSETKDGEKVYRPWTFFDDGEWRKTEPEGSLPIWGMEHLGDLTTVFIHEGAKAARAMHRLTHPSTSAEKKALAEHPWGDEMQSAAHLGWIGGALSPSRTDWAQLAAAGVKRAYIVADNDKPGKAAVPKISQKLGGITTFSIEFNETFPASFDLADEFPPSFFKKLGSKRHYIGPAFRACLNPATWATDQLPNPAGQGRPITVLREEFRSLWVWVEENDLYVCREMPEIMRQAPIFDGMVAPFSHVAQTSALLKKNYQGRQTRLAYRPDIPARMINDGQTSALNLHTPTLVKPSKGDIKPWEDFLSYLFPNEKERHEVKRWCATLIARPEVRMLYAMLLVSTQQGMGKSTLGERVLAPLVGMHNVGFPSEREIVESNFNSWIANKRLVVVGEIYTGQSWKAYNTLKGYVTDKKIDVNEKFMRPYTIENWAHILACSNSQRALRIEETDRRWFYPTISEVPWTREQFGSFHAWLSGGGLGIVRTWAEEFGDYVQTGEHSPMTDAKRTLIRESMSEPLKMLQDWCEANPDADKGIAGRWIKRWLVAEHKTVHESELDLRRAMAKYGWRDLGVEKRLQIEGTMQAVLLPPALFNEYSRQDFGEGKEGTKAEREWLRSRLSYPWSGNSSAM